MKTFKISGNDISDGYHTFDELYIHRNLLFINLCLELKDKCITCYRPDFKGWFILYLELNGKQISYHIQDKYLFLVEGKINLNPHYPWDGHTSEDVINRLAGIES